MLNVLPYLKLIARGFALFAGFYTLMNLTGEIWTARFDATVWLLDPGTIPPHLARIFLAVLGITMSGFGLVRYRRATTFNRICRITTAATGLIACSVAIGNATTFFHLIQDGHITSSTALPLSLFVALGFLLVTLIVLLPSHRKVPPTPELLLRYSPVTIATILFLVFPLLQVHFFGSTDYSRRADAAIVFGAKAYANGRPSLPLADRVRHACALYNRGYVHKLIFSGGPGDGQVHETESMKRLALSLGVDEKDIWLDKGGLSTEETVRNTTLLRDSLGIRSLVAVSQDYHLPRIKMAFQRYGINVYTSPAPDNSGHGSSAKQLARETLAFWIYYLRPLANVT